MTLSKILADFVADRDDFSEQARYLAKRSIIDSTGAMIAGCRTHCAENAFRLACRGGNATIVGFGRGYIPRDAAFVNGIAGHELELDDTASSNLGHPTIAVLPSVLALGEENECSGEKVLKAFILATEVECKIGRICAKYLHERGWHASSITGVIGAAAGSGYILGQDAEKLMHTIGIAASMASGVRENFGTATKSIHIGKTASDGVYAAQLADAGFDSSPSALDGKEGYLFEYSTKRFEEFGDDFAKTLGNDWDVCSPGFAIKRYPSCSSTHRAVDGLVDIINENGIKAADIKSITCGLSKPAMRELVTPYPKNGEEAKFSIGFQIALYLNGVENMPNNYTEEVIFRPEIQDIINKTSMYNKEDYDDLPSDMGVGPAFDTIETVDGRVLTKEQVFPVGHLTNPMSDEELFQKYMKCTDGNLPRDKAEKIHEMLSDMEKVDDIRKIMELMY